MSDYFVVLSVDILLLLDARIVPNKLPISGAIPRLRGRHCNPVILFETKYDRSHSFLLLKRLSRKDGTLKYNFYQHNVLCNTVANCVEKI